MPLNPVATSILVIFYLVASLVLIVLIGVTAYLLFRVNTVLEAFQARLDPLLTKADVLLATATEKVDSIGGKTEAILGEAEATAGAAHDRVERTAAVVQQTVSRPIVGVNALVAGVTRGAATFAALQRGGIGTGTPANDAVNGRNRASGNAVHGYNAPVESANGSGGVTIVTTPGPCDPIGVPVGSAAEDQKNGG
jgi:hypothetical protein